MHKQAGVRGVIFRVLFQQLCHAETQKCSHTGKRYVVVLLVQACVDYDRSVRTALVCMQTQVVYGLALEPVTSKSPCAGQWEQQTTSEATSFFLVVLLVTGIRHDTQSGLMGIVPRAMPAQILRLFQLPVCN